jgi:hypothetical protein
MSTLSTPTTPSPRRDKPANRWHRNAGVAAAAVLVYLLVTGIPLQFSAELDLGQRYVSADWVLDWYGLQAPALAVESGAVVQIGGWLFRDQQAEAMQDPLTGSVSLADFVVVASGEELLVFHRSHIESPERTQLGTAIRRIGSRQDKVYVDTNRGLLVADALLINWQNVATVPGPIKWATVARLNEAHSARYRSRFRARMLSIERWLQDLHSGRFFGSVGVVIIDLASLLLLILASTGLILWWRYQRA